MHGSRDARSLIELDVQQATRPPRQDGGQARKHRHDAALLRRDGAGITGRQLKGAWKDRPVATYHETPVIDKKSRHLDMHKSGPGRI